MQWRRQRSSCIIFRTTGGSKSCGSALLAAAERLVSTIMRAVCGQISIQQAAVAAQRAGRLVAAGCILMSGVGRRLIMLS